MDVNVIQCVYADAVPPSSGPVCDFFSISWYYPWDSVSYSDISYWILNFVSVCDFVPVLIHHV